MTRAPLLTLIAIALLSVELLGAPPARAQDDDEARSLFDRGTTAVHEGRFADARIDLERSLTLAPRAPTAFNLVVALRGMGQLVAASDVCEGLLAGRYGEIAPAQRAEAMPLCDAARAGVAQLAVRVGGEATLEIRIDGLAVGEAAPGELVEQDLDPGAHVVTIVSAGHAPIDRAIELEPGARTELELVGPAPRPASSDPDLGLVIGLSAGGAALVAAIVIVAVVASSSQRSNDGDYPVVATLLRF